MLKLAGTVGSDRKKRRIRPAAQHFHRVKRAADPFSTAPCTIFAFSLLPTQQRSGRKMLRKRNTWRFRHPSHAHPSPSTVSPPPWSTSPAEPNPWPKTLWPPVTFPPRAPMGPRDVRHHSRRSAHENVPFFAGGLLATNRRTIRRKKSTLVQLPTSIYPILALYVCNGRVYYIRVRQTRSTTSSHQKSKEDTHARGKTPSRPIPRIGVGRVPSSQTPSTRNFFVKPSSSSLPH